MFWKLMIAFVVTLSVGGALYLSGVRKAQLSDTLKYLEGKASSSLRSEPGEPKHEAKLPVKNKRASDELVSVDTEEKTAIGLQIATVEKQTKPIKLELTGRTAYDPDTLTKIRPRFDTLVEHVHASLGKKVKVGEPLVDMYSTELAKAKSDMQTKFVQWQHDHRLYVLREKLFKSGAISEQVWVDTVNDEKKSHLDYQLAVDLLNIYKVPQADIDALTAPLEAIPTGTGNVNNLKLFGEIKDKAKMTLVSPVEGIVIEREVVPQNLYDTSSVLMVLAPLDHLWVLLNVYELDQDKVRVGQTMEIRFPFLEQEKIKGTVQYVANEVSKDTRAIKIRATINNPGGRLKADMVLKAMLDIPPIPGQTVIPRLAMVSTNGSEYVFVRKPRKPDARPSDPDQFERRRIVVAQENVDEVVVSRGLKAGEEVVTNGSLIIAQLFEDQHMIATGVPMQ
jgi:cobalt-zinc-cadmium efflux system membrane fusion protein